MGKFNGFATGADSTADTSVFAGSAAPKLSVTALPSYWNKESAIYLEGFASSSGSSIALPTSDTASLTCYDASGSTLWTKTSPGAALTSYDLWYGFWLNDDATLLYVSLYNNGTAPDTFALITIDVAGTVVTLGTDTPSSDFTTALGWTTGTTMQPDGAGGFKMLNAYTNATNAQYAVINATGQFTTDPTTYYTNAATGMNAASQAYETTSGYLLNGSNVSATNGLAQIEIHNGTDNVTTYFPADSIKGTSTSLGGFVRWRSYVVFWRASGIRTGTLSYTVSAMDTFAKQLAIYSGVQK